MKRDHLPVTETSVSKHHADPTAGRILIVGGAPDVRVRMVDRLREDGHRCTHVADLASARAALRRRRFDLFIVHPVLCDGKGLDLVRQLHGDPRIIRSILFAEAPTTDLTIEAIRAGASDVLVGEPDGDVLSDRVHAALRSAETEKVRAKRIRKLQKICKDLDSARTEISDQVDLLCDDMLAAYRNLTERMDDMVIASEFRTLIRQELDVEDALRTALQYLLTRTGPTNAAVFLPDEGLRYNLGAYVNFDCPRESINTLLDHFSRMICPQIAHEPDIVAFDDAREFSEWIGVDDCVFSDSNVLAFACPHEGKSMAVVILFRHGSNPFPAELAGTLDTLRTLFAEQLARLTEVHHRARPQWPAAPDDIFDEDFGDDTGFGFGGLAA